MQAPDPSSLREHRERLILAHVNAENTHDLDQIMATFAAPCYDLRSAGRGLVEGDQAVRELQHANWRAFPDLRYEVVKLHHTDDAVILEYRILGRHSGTYLDVPPSRATIDMLAIAVFEFDGRNLICERPYVNQALLTAQMKSNTGDRAVVG